MILGCLLDLCNALACIGSAVALFPVINRQDEGVAIKWLVIMGFRPCAVTAASRAQRTPPTFSTPWPEHTARPEGSRSRRPGSGDPAATPLAVEPVSVCGRVQG